MPTCAARRVTLSLLALQVSDARRLGEGETVALEEQGKDESYYYGFEHSTREQNNVSFWYTISILLFS